MSGEHIGENEVTGASFVLPAHQGDDDVAPDRIQQIGETNPDPGAASRDYCQNTIGLEAELPRDHLTVRWMAL